MSARLERAFFLLTCFLIIMTPLREFLYIILGSNPPSILISGLKYGVEILPFLTLFAAVIVRIFIIKKPLSKPRYIVAALALLAWASLSFIWSVVPLWQSLRGFKVDFGGLLALLVFWLIPFSEHYKRKFLKVLLGVFAFLIAFNVFEFFNNDAFRSWANQTFDRHYLGTIPQLRSLVSGPNSYGTLMVLFSAVIALYFSGKTRIFLLALSGFVLGQTYGRSAWLAATIIGSGVFIYYLKKKFLVLWPLILGASLFIGAATGAIIHGINFERIVTHGESTEQHGEISLKELGDRTHSPLFILAFGDGPGTAGPATFGTSRLSISESWYIQLVQEFGIAGLSLYTWLIYETAKAFRSGKNKIMFLLTIGVAFNSIFLHTWSSDFNLNILFWYLVGVLLLVPGKIKDSYVKKRKNKLTILV